MKAKKPKSVNCNPEVKIVKINGDGTAVVSTEGLRRVVYGSESTDSLTLELISVEQATALAEAFNRDTCFVEVIDYATLATSAE